MAQRTTQLESKPNAPDVSLVAAKKPPPETLDLVTRPAKPLPPKSVVADEKAKAIEREKKKSSMQKVGSKVMIVFIFSFSLFSSYFLCF